MSLKIDLTTLTELERAAVTNYRAVLDQQSNAVDAAATDEEFIQAQVDRLLQGIVKTYLDTALPNLMGLSEQFLGKPKETQDQILKLLNS